MGENNLDCDSEPDIDIDWRDTEGNGLLHLSVKCDDEERARYLLEHGFNVNDINDVDETPLDYANFGNPRMVKLLLDAKAGSYVGNSKRRGPLHLAVLAGSLESVNVILISPQYSYSCHPDDEGKTPLDYAIKTGSIEIAQVILQWIAQKNYWFYSEKLIRQAVQRPEDSIAVILQDSRINVQGEGSLLLHFAVCLPKTDIAFRMIQNGADVNIQDSHGESVLHKAVKYNNSQQVKLLVDHGAAVLYKAKYIGTPLHYYAHDKVDLGVGDSKHWQQQSYEIYKLLLAKGASCNEWNGRGTSPFLTALASESLAIIKLLLEYGADMRAVDLSGRTALHYVAENQNEDVVEFILDQGFDIEGRTRDGLTGLHYSVESENLEGCRVFLGRGAAVNSKCIEGQTPLSRAVSTRKMRQYKQIMRLLLEHGADIADGLIKGKSILEFVAKDMDHNMEIRNILMQHMAKLKCLGLPLHENDRVTIENVSWYNVYYQKCLHELEDMKKAIFYYNLSVFNLVTNNDKVLSGYARNDELLNALKEINCENRFPIYFESLKTRLLAAVNMQRLLDVAAKVVEGLFEFNDPFHVISKKIVSFFKEKDLKLLAM